MRLSSLVILVLAVLGCDLVNPNETDYRQGAINETARREGLWKALQIHDYDFQFQSTCVGCTRQTPLVTIRVRNDAVARVTDNNGTDQPIPGNVPWPTVDSLYLWTRRFLEDRTFAVAVEFDTTFQFPQLIQAEDPGRRATEHISGNFVKQLTGTPALRAARISGAR